MKPLPMHLKITDGDQTYPATTISFSHFFAKGTNGFSVFCAGGEELAAEGCAITMEQAIAYALQSAA